MFSSCQCLPRSEMRTAFFPTVWACRIQVVNCLMRGARLFGGRARPFDGSSIHTRSNLPCLICTSICCVEAVLTARGWKVVMSYLYCCMILDAQSSSDMMSALYRMLCGCPSMPVSTSTWEVQVPVPPHISKLCCGTVGVLGSVVGTGMSTASACHRIGRRGVSSAQFPPR
jgi:hypothetical protein